MASRGFPETSVVIELMLVPGRAAEVRDATIRDPVRLVSLKDVSALYLDNPSQFVQRRSCNVYCRATVPTSEEPVGRAMKRILRGLGSRTLRCGCVVGLYETYHAGAVAILDARGAQ